jgi:hypothetical protein
MRQGVSTILSNGQTNYTPAHIEELWGKTTEGEEIERDLSGGVSSTAIHASHLHWYG